MSTRRFGDRRRERLGLSLLGVVLFFLAWYTITDVLHVFAEVTLPSPFTVASEFQRVFDLIVSNYVPTLQAGLVGFAASLLLAILVSIPLTASERVHDAFMPVIVAGNSVPRVTLAPLIIFYVGVGLAANYLIAMWIAFFPLLINTVDGLANVDEDMEALLDVIGATTWQEYRYVRFVNALPSIFDGMKTGVSLAIIGAIVGEFVAAERGLGNLALIGLSNANLALVLAIVAIMGLTTTALIFGIYALQTRLVFWKDVSLFGGEN